MRTVKRLAIIIVGIVAVVVLCAVGLIVVVEAQTRHSQKQVSDIVAQFAPGTPFTNVVSRLGLPNSSLTNAEEIQVFGSLNEPGIVTNSVLHMFVHRGPPYRWILIYTDKGSQKVVYAGWKSM